MVKSYGRDPVMVLEQIVLPITDTEVDWFKRIKKLRISESLRKVNHVTVLLRRILQKFQDYLSVTRGKSVCSVEFWMPILFRVAVQFWMSILKSGDRRRRDKLLQRPVHVLVRVVQGPVDCQWNAVVPREKKSLQKEVLKRSDPNDVTIWEESWIWMLTIRNKVPYTN